VHFLILSQHSERESKGNIKGNIPLKETSTFLMFPLREREEGKHQGKHSLKRNINILDVSLKRERGRETSRETFP